ncbi:DUF1156 domain-containing protein [Prescottella equi]|uniref:DUF1156 domain-containing protein n=1 Tax=Rhodococcus hoagii TaxID=43767 RepID=UPI001F3858B4|nr:DUF1156 domain-containing protein [Prescottella equi]
MIERWFPSAEVSGNSVKGWGSGNQERGLFTWFAARPVAQAKAAVLCSLLPWPDNATDQERLQKLVREAMTGRYAAWAEIRAEVLSNLGEATTVLDPFSGRGMIPLEAARLGIQAEAVDYSPVALLASELLTDYPFRDWSAEPPITFSTAEKSLFETTPRLLRDIERVLDEVGRRHHEQMRDLYPDPYGNRPWGYLWAATLPCQECGNRFPLVASYELRRAAHKPARANRPALDDPGQSFYIDADLATGKYQVVVHDGAPQRSPTFTNALGPGGKKIKGKSATCPFCAHVHPLAVHQRLAQEGLGQDALLVIVSPDSAVGRHFRLPTAEEIEAARRAGEELRTEEPFSPSLPAVPHEEIPENNGATIRPQLYGASTYGDLMCDRQSLYFVRLCRSIQSVDDDLKASGIGAEYRAALCGYATATMVRMLKFSTRGAKMRSTPGAGLLDHIFTNEGTVGFSYDFIEAGLSDGPGSWAAMSASTKSTLKGLLDGCEKGKSVHVQRGSAAVLPFKSATINAVVTDPPYDAMVYYSDSSDFFYAWIKRALISARPELAFYANSDGLQDKTQEIIVKEHGKAIGEHRTREHYDRLITEAFSEMKRVVQVGGVVTIVFGHGEPEVWQRLLKSIEQANLVMTASWPANTESGGQQGKANIQTTLTMACRPAPTDRNPGRKGAVEAEIKAEIKRRYPDWERWGLAPADMLMAAAGPAMEVVGRYSEVLDAMGERVDIHTFLPLARSAVQEAMAVEVDHHPLETFDARTRFALWWVRLYGRQIQAKSELRWQALASSLDIADVRDLVPDSDKGVRFTYARTFQPRITAESAVVDVALALAAASDEGIARMGEVLAQSGRNADDAYLWAAVKFFADRLPDSDPDAIAFTRVLRTRDGIATAADAVMFEAETKSRAQRIDENQLRLL